MNDTHDTDETTEGIARRCGARHFHKGRAYADNPYGVYLATRLHLAWSEGFNGARAASMLAARDSEGAR